MSKTIEEELFMSKTIENKLIEDEAYYPFKKILEDKKIREDEIIKEYNENKEKEGFYNELKSYLKINTYKLIADTTNVESNDLNKVNHGYNLTGDAQ